MKRWEGKGEGEEVTGGEKEEDEQRNYDNRLMNPFCKHSARPFTFMIPFNPPETADD